MSIYIRPYSFFRLLPELVRNSQIPASCKKVKTIDRVSRPSKKLGSETKDKYIIYNYNNSILREIYMYTSCANNPLNTKRHRYQSSCIQLLSKEQEIINCL